MTEAFLNFLTKFSMLLGLGGLVVLFLLNMEFMFEPRKAVKSLRQQLIEVVQPGPDRKFTSGIR